MLNVRCIGNSPLTADPVYARNELRIRPVSGQGGQGGQLLSDEVVGQIFDLLFHSQQQVICGIKLAVVHSESLR